MEDTGILNSLQRASWGNQLPTLNSGVSLYSKNQYTQSQTQKLNDFIFLLISTVVIIILQLFQVFFLILDIYNKLISYV